MNEKTQTKITKAATESKMITEGKALNPQCCNKAQFSQKMKRHKVTQDAQRIRMLSGKYTGQLMTALHLYSACQVKFSRLETQREICDANCDVWNVEAFHGNQ